MPIGNLTSQVFANIYLNELDRFVKHTLKPAAYLRYGDDFVLFCEDQEKLEKMRVKTVNFLTADLKLRINSKNDIMVKAKHGLKFLGVKLWPYGRQLTQRNKIRIANRLNLKNIPSYHGVISKHGGTKMKKWLSWKVYAKLEP